LMKKSKIIKRMRFKETEQKSEEPDSLDIKFNIGEAGKNSFLDDASSGGESKDKELIRREGLDNGHVKYNDKRTVNVETNDFSDLYYDLLSSE